MASFDAQTLGRGIRRLVIGVVVLGIVGFVGCSTTKRIDAGHVGVKISLAGGDRGVQRPALSPGWHFYNPITEEIVLFPTTVFNIVWSASAHEGRPVDESITFASAEGANINADVGFSFHVDPLLAPDFYEKFRQTDVLSVASTFMRNTVREAFNDAASKLKVDVIYGVGKTQMLKDATDKCSTAFKTFGITIDQLTLNSGLRLPKEVEAGIERALGQQQANIAAVNKQAQVEAEKNQKIKAAEGEKAVAITKAEGEAQSALIRAAGEAKANEIIRLSTTPAVLQYRALQRWNGQLPAITGSSQVPLLTFDVSKVGVADIPEAERQRRLQELLTAAPGTQVISPDSPIPGTTAPAPTTTAPAPTVTAPPPPVGKH